MKTLIFILILGLCSITFAYVNSGSASGSCSNVLPGYGAYTITTTQTAVVTNGSIVTETHTFVFSGFLSEMENAHAVGGNERHIAYENSKFLIAVPYVSGAGFYFKDKNSGDFPKRRSPTGWIKLCNY